MRMNFVSLAVATVTAASAAQAQEQVVDTSNVNQELIQTDET